MVTRIIDPDRFILAGGIVDWAVAAKKHGLDAAAIAAKRKITPSVLQLRWMLDPKLGLPTEAFQVWRRPHTVSPLTAAPIANVTQFQMLFGWNAWSWDAPLTFVQGTITVASGTVIIGAYAGAPFFSALIGVQAVTGTQNFSFSGTGILSLVVMGNAPITNLRGLDFSKVADDPAWQPFEVVGFPVQPAQWVGVGRWSKDQGMVGALMPPVDAALDRYRRGAPFAGWDDPIEVGRPAPPWIEADPTAIAKTLQADMFDDLRKMMTTLTPDHHISFRVQHGLALAGGSQTASTSFSPISTLMLGIASDTQASLVAGFGTAYADPRDQTPLAVSLPKSSPFDFMVTAHFEKGLDGASAAVEIAAILCGPGPVMPPPMPANVAAPLDGLASPAALDARFHALARVVWDQVPQATPFRVAAYALARYGLTPAGTTTALMGPRKLDAGHALQPISATTSQQVGDSTGQLRASDDTYALDSAAAPNVIRYAVAHEDIFGQWSAWSTANAAPAEPKVAKVSLVAARLDTGALPAPPGTVCDATLTVDLTWDWTIRSPRTLQLAGRLYAAAKPGAPPSDLSIPAGLQTLFSGGAGALFDITFNGSNAGSVPAGATLSYISDDAKTVLTLPVVVSGPRRYRLKIPGFKLNFASTGHVGLALWARARENLAPQRTGDWSAEPLSITASDPRPPVITAEHEDVQLTSLGDAKGEHRARLAWDPLPGAAGYFVYETTESKFRVATGLGEAPASMTMSDRLHALRDAFEATPLREPFTRMNSTALTGTTTEVVIGRGSREIHLYLVLGFSAGQIESAWPGLGDAARRKRFQAFAAPQVVPPTPPRLEVKRTQVATMGGPSYRAGVTLTTRPGATVTRLDLYRVRVPEASLELDTMGPPVARISGSDVVWTAHASTGTGPGEAQALGVVTGADNPGGSWKRVYYRAVAISGDRAERAIYGGRSGPTGATWVVIPPDGPPDMSAITADWPGGALEAVRFTITSPAPVAATDLGPHRLRLESFAVAADGTRAPLFAWPPAPPANAAPDTRLEAVPAAATPAPSLHAEDAGGGLTRYVLLLTRPHLADAVAVRVLLTDPLGRATERLVDSPGGSPLPMPDILTPVVTPQAGARFILTIGTDALFTTTPLGPYRLTVKAAAKPTLANPHPAPVTVDVALPAIAPLILAATPFTDAAPIPLRRQRGGHINIYLRAAAQVDLTMTAPDGRSSHLDIGVP
jgi:hypothetical protein